MIGSLQEFLGEIDSKTFFSQEIREKKQRHRTHRVRSLENTPKNQTGIDVKPPNTAHIVTVKYQTKSRDSQTRSNPSNKNNDSQRSSSKDVFFDSQKCHKRQLKACKWTVHIPESKQNLLKAYVRLRRNEEQQSNAKIIEKLRQTTMQSSSKQSKKVSQMRLKVPLKHQHQLLRSIQRVEAEDLINPQTFLELSLENMGNSYNKIKMKPLLRCEQQFHRLSEAAQKQVQKLRVNDSLGLTFEAFSQVQKAQLNAKGSMVRSTHRILLENAHKWAKARAKSTKSYEKSLGKIEPMRQDSVSKFSKDRRDIMRRISELAERPKPLRKSSIMGNSRLFK